MARSPRSVRGASHATEVIIAPVRQSDAGELIAANVASQRYHEPWASSLRGSGWLRRLVRADRDGIQYRPGRARAPAQAALSGWSISARWSGVRFRSAFLGYHGIVAFAGQGFMTEARASRRSLHGFDDVGFCIGWRRISSLRTIPPSRLCSRLGFRKEGFSPKYLKIGERLVRS